MIRARAWLLLAALLAALATPAIGVAQTRTPDLAQISIEDLMNVEISSASRKDQRAADVAGAIFVITHDDIRRSGMSALPDLLRLSPGVDVAQVNSNKWAVSVRGFNALYANKVLVLIDGRSVYNRIFSGVLWDAEDLMLEDIDRIEVIRGPGAVMWGANAVNGVINIITKTTADTLGGLVAVETGRAGNQGAARYGGALGRATYRVYSQWTGRDQSLITPGTPADDASHSVTTGFRVDWTMRPGAFVLEGDFTAGQARALWPNLNPSTAARDPIANDVSDSQGGHLLGRWIHTRAGGAAWQVQSFVDVASRQEPIGNYHRHAVDLDTQYHTAFGSRQDVIAGAGYRFIDEKLDGQGGVLLIPSSNDSSLFTAFLQDEIAFFGSRLAVTLGSQAQYDSVSGAGVQPTARMIWKGLPRQRIWAAASRALRTPSLSELGIRLNYPPVPTDSGLPLVVTTTGNAAAMTETVADLEAGYRIEFGKTASLDVTGFVGSYEHVATQEPGAPVVEFVPAPQVHVTSQVGNLLAARTGGLEVAGHWAPVPAWRLDGSYTSFHITPQLAAASRDASAATTDGSAPGSQWQIRSAFSLGSRATLGVALFHVGPIEQMQVPAYTRADVTAQWRFTRRLSAMAIGQNLFDEAHAEFGGSSSVLLATQVPRSASLRLRWEF